MKLTLVCLLIFLVTTADAQTVVTSKPVVRNNIAYIEAGGICAYYSLNYQRNVPVSGKVDVAIGISGAPVYTLNKYADRKWSPRVGLQAQAVYKIGRHEIGAGPAICWYTYRRAQTGNVEAHYDPMQSAISAQAGYAYTTKNGIYLGVYFTPIISDANQFDFTPWGGLRLGYRF